MILLGVGKSLKMEKGLDLSFSGIVDYIQGDEKVGAEMLVSIARRKEIVDLNIDELQSKLDTLNAERTTLLTGKEHVMNHLEKSAPLAVKRDEFIVVVTDKNISIERNVL